MISLPCPILWNILERNPATLLMQLVLWMTQLLLFMSIVSRFKVVTYDTHPHEATEFIHDSKVGCDFVTHLHEATEFIHDSKLGCDFVTYSLRAVASDNHSHKTTEFINDS